MRPLASEVLAGARTWLFLPGDRLDRLPRALTSGAEVVIVDLEDGVGTSAKARARASVVAALHDARGSFVVRVNAPGTESGRRDLDALAALAGPPPALLGVMVPKVEGAADLAVVATALGTVPLVPLIETARGLIAVTEIGTASGVVRLGFGGVDFSRDIGAHGDEPLGYARAQLVIASRALGLAGPVDAPCLSIDDDALIAAEARGSRAAGMTAKLCIHPAQVPTVREGLAPTEAEREWARSLLEATGSTGSTGASAVDGRLVDRPVLARARHILAEAEQRPRHWSTPGRPVDEGSAT